MIKGEIEILASIILNKSTSKQLSVCRLARHSPYLLSTLESLKQQKYIIENKSRKYQITTKGIRALVEFYPAHPIMDKTINAKVVIKQMTEARKAIKMIESLSSEYTSRIDPGEN